MTHEAIDEVIFDYLEGNLSAEEKDAFDVLLNESEVTTYQVKLWRNAYVNEPLPSVEILEQRLLRPVAGNPAVQSSFWQKLLIGLTIAFSALIIQKSGFEFPTSPIANVSPTISDETPTNLEWKMVEIECPDDLVSPQHLKTNSKDYETPRQLHVMTLPVLLNISNVNTSVLEQALMGDVELRGFEILVTEPNLGVKTVKRRLSASERRSINRKKRKEYENKMAIKFMKGNVPYVVPLKSNNF
jgi:hypothetical protein